MIIGRLGLVGFFGLLVPGIYLASSLLLAFATLSAGFGILSWADFWSQIGRNTFQFSTAFFFFSYLLGVVMRLMGSNRVDELSTFYFRVVRPVLKGKPNDKNGPNAWRHDVFPYQESFRKEFERNGLGHINTFFMSHTPKYGQKGNTTLFDFFKMVLEGNNAEMSRIATQSESMVRFLSGTAIALAASVVLWSVLCILLAFTALPLALFSLLAAILSLLLLWPIIARFRFLRLREVKLVWYGTYLVLTGGVPNPQNKSPYDLQKSAFGAGPATQSSAHEASGAENSSQDS